MNITFQNSSRFDNRDLVKAIGWQRTEDKELKQIIKIYLKKLFKAEDVQIVIVIVIIVFD